MHEIKKKFYPKSVLCAFVIMVRHGTARRKFCSYKTEEALQIQPQSNSNFYGSARRGTTYKTGLKQRCNLGRHLVYHVHLDTIVF